MSKTKCDLQLWPVGMQFSREIMIPLGFGLSPEEGIEPAGYEDFPVIVTFTVPPFDVVVETWQNRDQAKAYPLFRQFIVGWDQEDTLTDQVLMGFLYAYPGTDEAMYRAWCDYMKEVLTARQLDLPLVSNSIN
ncbi:hypothetical protein [Atlantibacter hermannii]|uniref:hypothetical protein n=1 Tax=Atlantibacter hermannii TaxID=565 RepID=UPI0028A88281|nr:hypothetical protein [Atlantibacter hermannii]